MRRALITYANHLEYGHERDAGARMLGAMHRAATREARRGKIVTRSVAIGSAVCFHRKYSEQRAKRGDPFLPRIRKLEQVFTIDFILAQECKYG